MPVCSTLERKKSKPAADSIFLLPQVNYKVIDLLGKKKKKHQQAPVFLSVSEQLLFCTHLMIGSSFQR